MYGEVQCGSVVCGVVPDGIAKNLLLWSAGFLGFLKLGNGFFLGGGGGVLCSCLCAGVGRPFWNGYSETMIGKYGVRTVWMGVVSGVGSSWSKLDVRMT